jgi:hypothetical protein
MILAGLSEFLIAAGVVFALWNIRPSSTPINALVTIGLLSTLVASLLGAVTFLSAFDTSQYHQVFTYFSKHIGMTAFIIGASWSHLKSHKAKQFALAILVVAAGSFTVNFFTKLDLLSVSIMLIALIFVAYQVAYNKQAQNNIFISIALLMSTLLWGAIIKDTDIRIGIFHVCVAAFLLFFTLALRIKRVA